ncbi:MAG: hypothetical protein NVS3B20_21750 [Polyangiales bacterium]
MSTSRVLIPAAVLAAALSTLTGCPGSLDEPDRFRDAAGGGGGGEGGPVDPCDVPAKILKPKCATSSGCHSAADKTEGLDLESPGLKARLVDHPLFTGAGAITPKPAGAVLIHKSGDLSKSMFWLKLVAPPLTAAPYGSPMPLTGGKLNESDLTCVKNWVAQGDGTGGGGGGGGDAGTGETGSEAGAGDGGKD